MAMQQFNKWWKKNKPENYGEYNQDRANCELTWKAALEWANSHRGYEIADYINEELDE